MVGSGVGLGARMDVNEKLKFLEKIHKKSGGGSGGGVRWGVELVGETKNRRYCTMYKKVLYNIKKIKKCGGGGRGNI